MKRLRLSKSVYSRTALEISAAAFAKRAEVYVGETKSEWDLEFKSLRKKPTEAQMTALGGDFLNELLSQEYRFLVSSMNKDVASLQATQALWAASGGEGRPVPPKETAAFKKEAAALLKAAVSEFSRVTAQLKSGAKL